MLTVSNAYQAIIFTYYTKMNASHSLRLGFRQEISDYAEQF